MKQPLKLVASNKYPTRKISTDGLEAIQAFLSARSAMYQAITDLENIFEIEISLDEGERHLFDVADFNFSDWPADKAISLQDANKFIQQFKGERPINEITDEQMIKLHAVVEAMRLRPVPKI